MKVTYLEVGNRRFYLETGQVQQVMAAAAAARNRGDWIAFRDVAGRDVRILLPSDVLLVVHEYESDEPGDGSADPDPNDWASFDYDF